jgi:asparagine synthase (glutamine-hydrolysing)
MCGIWSYISKNTIPLEQYKYLYNAYLSIISRGPESSNFEKINDNIIMGFHRLAINGLNPLGNQPFIYFEDKKHYVFSICNGEIYNYEKLVIEHNLETKTTSDCEVIPLLYIKYGEYNNKTLCNYLDGEYAFIIIDLNIETNTFKVITGRDPFGVRPLFYGFNNDSISFCSELKGLSFCDSIEVYPPGVMMTYDGNKLQQERFYSYNNLLSYNSMDKMEYISDIFTNSIKKRLMSERPLGCLLSGGLDSSIVSAITSTFVKNLHTFTIGLEGATDIKYAEMVAKHIGSKHTTFITTIQEALESIDKVIYTIESYDCTSIRASVWQYLLGKKISENTDIKVLLTGEGSDELTSGYMYFHNAPNPTESHNENVRLLQDIHRYDGLRVDRAMACHGLEVRIPFLDPEFVELYLQLPKELRIANGKNGRMEKQLFRDAFKDTDLLPHEVLYRKKEAFSDGTSSNEKSWFQIIQEYIDTIVSDDEFEQQKNKYEFNTPDTKEKYYYRKKFEEYFGSKAEKVIPYYWLPKWSGNITEPSARILKVYKQ